MRYEILHGDCREIVPNLNVTIDAVVTDPPYGCGNDCDYTRFSGGLSPSRNYHEGIAGDDSPFDPRWMLGFPRVCLFGFQFFAHLLPVGTVLVWCKKRDNQLGTFLSDAELAWMKGGKGCYLYRHIWHGFDRETERGKSLHPSQKPAALFRWVMGRMKLQPGMTVLDPYCGVGGCGVACHEMGLNYIGIDVCSSYVETARGRMEAVCSQS